MRAYLIDPTNPAAFITEVDYNGDWQTIAPTIDCQFFDVIAIDRNNVIYCDDEGLLKEARAFVLFRGYPHPIAGKCLLLGCDSEGDAVACSLSPEQVCDMFLGALEVTL